MKTTIYAIITAIAMLFISNFAIAEEVPAYMRDGVITVTLKSGKTYTYSLNEWMVVRRHGKSNPPDLSLADGAGAPRKNEEPQRRESFRNRLTLHGGAGWTGLEVEKLPGMVRVSQRRDFVFGATFGHMLDNRWSLSGTWLGNFNTTTFVGGGVGYDFDF